jgi:glycosyltransferase involved in cell wall biosynthesis
LASLIESLDRSIFQPVFCAHEEGPLTEALRTRGVELIYGGGKAIAIRHPIAALTAIWRQAKQLRSWEIDLLHANSVFWNTDLILAAWMLRIPVILHVHNPAVVELRNLNWFAARKVLFCSGFEMSNTVRFARIAHRAEVLHNAIDTAAVRRGVSIRANLGLTDGQVAIGTVAQVGHRKGIDILIETAAVLLRERDDLVFFIAGPVAAGEDEFGRRMQELAAEPALRGRVRFLGSRSDIPDFLASLDIFLLPSRAEPFGIVVIEAMAAGLPVIASKVGGIPEILSSPEIGRLVDPLAPEAFAAVIREILALPERGRQIGQNARFNVAERFDLAAAGRRLKKIYLDLLCYAPSSKR